MTRPSSCRVPPALLALSALAIMASATPTTAQEPSPAAAVDSDDWDFGEDASRRLTIAAVTFENFGVAVRCMNGSFSLILSGLPEATGERTIQYEMGDDEDAESLWVSARDSTSAFSVRPNWVAYKMSKGGRLTLTVPDGDQSRRIVADLPPSPQAMTRVFSACGRTMPEDRSRAEIEAAEAMSGLAWRSPPRVEFPAGTSATAGIAALTCHVKPDGGLRACVIESEFPVGGDFGRMAVLGAHQTGRIKHADNSREPIADRRISFIVRYAMSPTFF